MSARAAPPPVVAFAKLAFTELLTYRLRYVVGVVNYTIYMGVQYFLWSAVYASAPAGTTAIGTFRFQELVSYFAIGWIVRVSYFNNVDREFADRVRQGDITLDLLRPVSLLERYYGQALGEAVFRVFFMGLPTALVLFPTFGVSGPHLPPEAGAAAVRLLAFAASVALAFHVFFLINFLVGSMAVYFEGIQGILRAKFVLIQLLSGLLVPFDLFPGWARSVLELLPFRATIYSPVSIYLGRAEGAELARELGLQVAWVLVLYLAAHWVWARCRRKLMVFGG
jgi:ABC-2 type transport system permease protein